MGFDGTTKYALSECCNAYCWVPVDVTAHLLLGGEGNVTERMADTLADLRRGALSGDANAREAYCSECGADVNRAAGA